MDIIDRNLNIIMIREDLECIPAYDLPHEYMFRWYREGDEEHWVDIHQKTDSHNTINRGLFVREFKADTNELCKRQCYLSTDEGGYIGTATAWFDEDFHGLPYGRLHWVAIVPEFQGQGLSKPLLSIVCNRMKELGHVRTRLVTSTARIPAVNLYLSFGYVPFIRTSQDEEAWKALQQRLKYRIGRCVIIGRH